MIKRISIKVALLSIAILGLPPLVGEAQVTPTPGQNYIIKRIPRVATTSGSELLAKSAAQQWAVVEYYDGLGRPMQTQIVAGIPDVMGNGYLDLVTPHVYDGMGREYRELLPYTTSSSGSYRLNAVDANYSSSCEQYKFYNSTSKPAGIVDVRPFGEIQYDGSPLNRVVSQVGSGNQWVGHETKKEYGSNLEGEVTRWKIDSKTGALLNSGSYGAATLYRTLVKSENGSYTVEYKDYNGYIVRRIIDYGSGKENAITDYIYDEFGRLRIILPPKISKGANVPSESELKGLAFTYSYDDFGRLIFKKLPGSEPIIMVYDTRDRLIAVQDGELRKNNRWLYTRYDGFNRPVETGFVIKASKEAIESEAAVAAANDSPSGDTYTQLSFPITADSPNPITYTFYDSYTNGGASSINFDMTFGQSVTLDVTGLATVTRVKELVTNTWSTTTTFYDDKNRVIQTVKQGLFPDANGKVIFSTLLNFAGQPLQTVESQTFKGLINTLTQRYDYFDSGQLRGLYVKLNNSAEETIATYAYDSLGRIKRKSYGYGMQKQTYQYNIRSWLTQINDPNVINSTDYFAMKLAYEAPNVSSTGVVGQYGGNVSSVVWRTQSSSDNSKLKRGYGYKYDGMNRLSESCYATGEDLASNASYTEKGLTYDANGNVTGLTRTNGTNTASTYNLTYSGNQLLSINSGFTYRYDANGNTIFDGLRGFTITYNELNLPQNVSKGNQSVSYVYDATGAKLSTVNSDNSARYYHGSMVYEKSTTGTVALSFALHKEGTILSNGYVQYHLKDFLGNIRSVFLKEIGANKVTKVVQNSDYYPFGLLFENVNLSNNRYFYNGKELQDQVIGGSLLGFYDYGRRFYDPLIGRWQTIDPLAEKYNRFSPYHYCFDNPINSIDPDGRDIVVLSAKKGAHGAGHAAVLIGDENSGWRLYSKNGTTHNLHISGPNNITPNNGTYFKNLNDFSSWNMNEQKGEYTGAYYIKSDKNSEMTRVAKEELDKIYKLIGASCIDVVSAALEAAGLYGGRAWIPNWRYKSIVRNNPSGIDITSQIIGENVTGVFYIDITLDERQGSVDEQSASARIVTKKDILMEEYKIIRKQLELFSDNFCVNYIGIINYGDGKYIRRYFQYIMH